MCVVYAMRHLGRSSLLGMEREGLLGLVDVDLGSHELNDMDMSSDYLSDITPPSDNKLTGPVRDRNMSLPVKAHSRVDSGEEVGLIATGLLGSAGPGELITSERREKGQVSFGIYMNYFYSCGKDLTLTYRSHTYTISTSS